MRRLFSAAGLVTVLLVALLAVVVVTAVLNVPAPSQAAAAPTPPAPAEPAAPPAAAPAPGQPAPGQPAPTPPAPGQPPAAPGPATAPTSVAFIGDGYTSGTPEGGEGPANYTAILAGKDGFQATNTGVYGAGYVSNPSLTSQVSKAIAAGPQLVVVNAGRADVTGNPVAVRAAAGGLYQTLKTRLPQAKIVVIGPMWLGGNPPPEMLTVRDAIREAAAGAQLPFVDPITDRWFNGTDENGIAPSRQVLNDAGHQRIAQLVEDALKRNGALPG